MSTAGAPARGRGRSRITRGRRGDRGTSLVEVLVVSGLMGLLGTMLMTVSVQTAKIMSGSDERAQDTQTARVALEAMTRSLRAAADPDGESGVGSTCTPGGTAGRQCAFVDATSPWLALRSGPRQVAFFSSLYDLSRGGTKVLYRYSLESDGRLVEQVWSGAWAAGPTTLAPPSRQRVIARGLDTGPAAPPLFTYLSATDTTIPPAGPTVSSLTDPSGVTQSALLEPADVPKIAALEVWVAPVRTYGGRQIVAVDSVLLVNQPQVTP